MSPKKGESSDRALKVQPLLISRIQELHLTDPSISSLIDGYKNGEQLDFHLQNDGILCFQNRICIPNH